MAAVLARARAELRRRWRVTVLLAVLMGLTGGVVLAAVAGARRTDSAMDRFVAYNRPATVEVDGLDLPAVEQLPQVADVDQAAYMALTPSTPSGAPDPGAVGRINPWATMRGHSLVTSERPILVRGRLPDPDQALEVAIDETLAARRRLRLGGTLRMWAYTPRQLQGGFDSSKVPAPQGPALDFTVTGVVRQPSDLSPVPVQQDVIYLGTGDDLYLTPAFWRTYGRTVANVGAGVVVRLHHGARDLAAFTMAVRALPGGRQAMLSVGSDSAAAAGRAKRAMHVQAVALLAFGALTAVAGLLVVGQSIARQVQLDANDHGVLRALGMSGWQLAAVTLIRAALVGAAGAVLAVGLAVAASPLTPIGLARQAEIDPGLAVDVPILAVGALGVLVAVLARAAAAAWRAAQAAGASAVERPPRRSSQVAGGMARAGATPSLVTGVRLALEPARGETAAPLRTAMLGAVIAVAAVTASLTFAASLERLAHTPSLQGWNWDVAVGNANDQRDITPKGALLDRNPLVAGYSAAERPGNDLDVGGTRVPVIGVRPIKGTVLPRVLAGREARSAEEIALGRLTLRRLGRRLGDVVEVRGPDGPRSLRIVGEVLLPAESGDLTMANGAVLTLEGLRAFIPDGSPGQFLVEYAPGANRDAAYASLRRDFGPTVLQAPTADEVENLRRVNGLPFLLAALLGVLGVATLGHALVTSVRRRRDLAVLKTLGFVRRQVSATVAWQATTFAAVALLLGLPLGVATGRWAWVLVNQGLGSPAGPVTPALAVLAAVPATLLVANLVAAVPARAAAATRPAVVLRSE
jgi:ABC-type antimicrobial peptide transport system permease subunit